MIEYSVLYQFITWKCLVQNSQDSKSQKCISHSKTIIKNPNVYILAILASSLSLLFAVISGNFGQ